MRNVLTVIWVLGAATLSGCAETPLSRMAGGVDADSPSAAAVREALAHPYPYPDLKRLPPPPRDVRPVAAFGTQAASLEKDRGALQDWAVRHPPMTDDAEGYAASARGRGADPRPLPPADQADRSEAWAARMREASKPPPPPS